MKKVLLTNLERDIELKAERRRRKRIPKMRVSGKSVFAIQEAMRKQAHRKKAGPHTV